MYALNPYSPVYKELKKFEKECRDYQFPMYVERLKEILLFMNEQTFKKKSLIFVFNYCEHFRDRVRQEPSYMNEGMIFNRGFLPDLDSAYFLMNAFSIYGPKKLRDALDL